MTCSGVPSNCTIFHKGCDASPSFHPIFVAQRNPMKCCAKPMFDSLMQPNTINIPSTLFYFFTSIYSGQMLEVCVRDWTLCLDTGRGLKSLPGSPLSSQLGSRPGSAPGTVLSSPGLSFRAWNLGISYMKQY